MIPPVKKTLTVPVDVSEAFRRFTEKIGEWWPLASHSLGGEDAETSEMEGRLGGRVYEVWADGSAHLWGSVTVWEPPTRVAFTWHVGREPSEDQEVTVSFVPAGNGTRVELTHTGWEHLGDQAREQRDGYDGGWDIVLGRYEHLLTPAEKNVSQSQM